jgi:hypothetical protein
MNLDRERAIRMYGDPDPGDVDRQKGPTVLPSLTSYARDVGASSYSWSGRRAVSVLVNLPPKIDGLHGQSIDLLSETGDVVAFARDLRPKVGDLTL